MKLIQIESLVLAALFVVAAVYAAIIGNIPAVFGMIIGVLSMLFVWSVTL